MLADSTHVTTTAKLKGVIKLWMKNNCFNSNNVNTMINTFLNRFREDYYQLLTADGNENYHCLIELSGKKCNKDVELTSSLFDFLYCSDQIRREVC